MSILLEQARVLSEIKQARISIGALPGSSIGRALEYVDCAIRGLSDAITTLTHADFLTHCHACEAELVRREAIPGFYYDADRSEHDRTYAGMWQALIAWERDAHERGNPIYPNELRAVINGIAGEVPKMRPVFAVNTTHYDAGAQNDRGLKS